MAETTTRRINFDIDSLYVILSEQSQPNSWHWGIYLHVDEAGGWIFHIRNSAHEPWYFEHKRSETIMTSKTIMVALRVAIIRPKDMHGALQSFIGTTQSRIGMADPNQFGRLTCRTWVMQALYQLDQSGYISIMPGYTVQDIEFEADRSAELNSEIRTKRGQLTDKELLRDCNYSKA
ncbi:hypothetical protein CCM_02649 [Cordyceps militaris CM01]|uniref:Uncharacterized protein n=1 Tax=Cordyceps militaris (strain CM01) TaxID=983644 RepID=G3JAW5_CORMM|nr:uncharacterized protein CCM_02649 [Cordyceps militaris CM01]EGX94378.1 hypothetical protein CCM_02649 [Cordyceps militaris CM01]